MIESRNTYADYEGRGSMSRPDLERLRYDDEGRPRLWLSSFETGLLAEDYLAAVADRDAFKAALVKHWQEEGHCLVCDADVDDEGAHYRGCLLADTEEKPRCEDCAKSPACDECEGYCPYRELGHVRADRDALKAKVERVERLAETWESLASVEKQMAAQDLRRALLADTEEGGGEA